MFDDENGVLTGKGPIAKFIPADVQASLAAAAGIGAGDAVFFSAGAEDKAAKLAGLARDRIADELGLIDKDRFELAWIVDFPFYEWNEDEKKVDFSHNPFSMPQGGLEALNAQEPLKIKAFQYDVVCNGFEIASGGIRNHRPEAMVKAFEIAGYGEETVIERFGGMYRALQFGAPPHGGMAAGVDRIVMLLLGAKNLREITMFPMNQQAQDLMMGAPSAVSARQLRELSIRLTGEGKAGAGVASTTASAMWVSISRWSTPRYISSMRRRSRLRAACWLVRPAGRSNLALSARWRATCWRMTACCWTSARGTCRVPAT